MLSPPGIILCSLHYHLRRTPACPASLCSAGTTFSGLLPTLSALCRLVRHSSAHCICLVPACPAARLAWHLPAYSIAPRHTLLCTTLSSLSSSASSHAALPALAGHFCLQNRTCSAGRGYRQHANSSAGAIVGRLFVEIDSGTKHSYNTYHKAGGYETNTPDIPHRSMANRRRLKQEPKRN